MFDGFEWKVYDTNYTMCCNGVDTPEYKFVIIYIGMFATFSLCSYLHEKHAQHAIATRIGCWLNDVDNKQTSSLGECSICLETTGASAIARLPCSHEFHVHCIKNWLVRSPTCPICRKEFYALYDSFPPSRRVNLLTLV